MQRPDCNPKHTHKPTYEGFLKYYSGFNKRKLNARFTGRKMKAWERAQLGYSQFIK
jgi:hypothetical protein